MKQVFAIRMLFGLVLASSAWAGPSESQKKTSGVKQSKVQLVRLAERAYQQCTSNLRLHKMDLYCDSIGSVMGIGAACSVLYFAYGLCGANGLSPEVYSQDQLTTAQYDTAREYYFRSYLVMATKADIQLMIRSWNKLAQGDFSEWGN